MTIEILRLNHRIGRDPRISTHVCLTARAFGATKAYYSGQKDSNLEESLRKVTEKFGGPFELEYTDNGINLIKKKKEEGFFVVHLTVYGKDFRENKKKIKKTNLLVIVGGEKVESEFYKLADLNLSVTNQPISEISALGIFLYDIFGYRKNFTDVKTKIIGTEKGKILKQI